MSKKIQSVSAVRSDNHLYWDHGRYNSGGYGVTGKGRSVILPSGCNASVDTTPPRKGQRPQAEGYGD